MSIKKHIQLLIYSFLTWLLFFILGLPDYYQRFSLGTKLFLVVLVTVIYVPITKHSLNRFWTNGRDMTNSYWLAFYLTLPFFIYDYLLLGLYKGLGIGFVFPYWYLTFFYFSFWVQFPLIARKMKARRDFN